MKKRLRKKLGLGEFATRGMRDGQLSKLLAQATPTNLHAEVDFGAEDGIEEAMKIYREGARKYRNALRQL